MSTERYQVIRKVTLISAFANVLLGVFKIAVGIAGYSHALIADGIHSLGDLLTDALVLIAAKASHKRPDKEHPYGHGRIETLATAVVATMLVMVGIALAYDVIMHALNNPDRHSPTLPVFIVAIAAIIVNEVLFRYGMYHGKKINSSLVISNAWHHRSDGLVSIVVLISVIGAYLGVPYLDTIGAVVIALMIMRMGFKMILDSVRELIDTGADLETVEKIRAKILSVHGVDEIHMLRTRLLGGEIFVDVHILVDPTISVSEGHYISDRVMFALHKEMEGIRDVTVHVDPEDDEVAPPSSHLPNRQKIATEVEGVISGSTAGIVNNKIILHYREGKIDVDVYFAMQDLEKSELTPQQFQQQLTEAAKSIEHVDNMNVYFEIN